MSRNWQYEVFISFRGEDLRYNFFSHFLKELDRKLIKTFKDMEIKKGESLDPVLKQAIKGSRIAVVLFSENYASSGWCLNELLEILKCHKENDQVVIPIFHGVDPSDVRKQTGPFGKVFEDTCKKNTEELKNQWKEALTKVANLVGTHFKDSDDEAKRVELIANDLLGRLKTVPSKDYEKFVGIEDHIKNLRVKLDLGSLEVKRVGLWGPSGIGKTTIARVMFNQLSPHFGGRIYIDKHSISRENYKNLADHNTKLHLQESFLSKLLDKEGIIVDHLDSVEEKLKHQKVLIFIDDLDDQMVLDVLADRDEWFGPGSRILAITKDRQILRASGIKCFYEVGIPSEKVALQIFCQSAFKEDSPPDGRYMELASEIAMRAGGLPLGLILLGSSLRGRDKECWEKMLTTVKDLDGKIEQALRVSYDALEKDQHREIFRHIACFFNGDEINYIKLMLADIEYDIGIGLDILIDKSLIHVIQSGNKSIVEMHCLVEEMGKEVVHSQSKKPGEREFLIGSKDVCNVLKNKTDAENVLGISLDLNEIDELKIHKKAFKKMRNLRFLRFYTNSWERVKEVKWSLPKEFNDFPSELKLLSWPGYPMKQLPVEFCPEKLVELRMPNSKILEKLWEGDKPLEYLKDMDLSESQNLKEIPDLSKATNLETLNLQGCSSLTELPSSIQNLNKLTYLNMAGCTKLEDLPTGALQSLIYFNLAGCSQLKIFPDISNKITELIINKTAFKIFPSQLRLENLVELSMEHIMSEKLWEGAQPLTNLKTIKLLGSENLKEIPDLSMATSLETLNLNNCSSLEELTLSSIQNLNKLTSLDMIGCSSLETLPIGINLKSLYRLNLNGCSQLRGFPDISNNITFLFLNQTAIEEVPSHINNFSNLEALEMWECKELKCISPGIFELENLDEVFFSECEHLVDVKWPEEADDTNLSVISFTNCFYMNQETFIQQSSSAYLILPGEVPLYFTHRSTGNSFTIPLHHSSLSQQSFLDFKACVVVSDLVVGSEGSEAVVNKLCFMDIEVHCHFMDKNGNYFEPAKRKDLSVHQKYNHQIIFGCHFPLSLECDQVEIKFILPNERLKLKRCGVRLSDDSTPLSAIQNEADESIAGNGGVYKAALSKEECGDESDDEGYETALDEDESDDDEDDCGDNSDG